MADKPPLSPRRVFRIPTCFEEAQARDEELKQAIQEIESQLGDAERRRVASATPESWERYERWRRHALGALQCRHREREFLRYWRSQASQKTQRQSAPATGGEELSDFAALFGPEQVHPTTIEAAMALRQDLVARLNAAERELAELRGDRRIDEETGEYMGEAEFNHRRSRALQRVTRLSAQTSYLRRWIRSQPTAWSTTPVVLNADDPAGLLRACYQLLESTLRGHDPADRRQMIAVVEAVRQYLSRHPTPS